MLRKIVLIIGIGLILYAIGSNHVFAQTTKKNEVTPALKTVIIGNQEWMVSNLNVAKFRNGDIIFSS